MSAYIPTNVISITDGQIFLETELFHSGVMPAVNPGISVSRVGGNAQIKAMKKVAGSLKLLYSQYRELQGFAQFGSDLDADTKARLAQGERIVEVLKQNRNRPVAVEDQVCIFYAVTHDFLKEVTVSDVAEYETGLYERMEAQHSDVLDAIRESRPAERGDRGFPPAGAGKLHPRLPQRPEGRLRERRLQHGRSVHERHQAAHQERGKHHADHQGHAACGNLQASPRQGADGSQQTLWSDLRAPPWPRPWPAAPTPTCPSSPPAR